MSWGNNCGRLRLMCVKMSEQVGRKVGNTNVHKVGHSLGSKGGAFDTVLL